MYYDTIDVSDYLILKDINIQPKILILFYDTRG